MDVTVLTSVSKLSELKSDWGAILAKNQEDNFYYSFDWIHAACHLFIHPVVQPFIVWIREDNKPVAIIPCCINRRRLRLFSCNCIELIGNIYSAYRGGVILRGREADTADALVRYLFTYRQLWDMIHFEDMPASNPFLAALNQAIQKRNNCIVRISEQYADLVYDFEPGMYAKDYWQRLGKNLKQQIRRSINKMNREGRFTVVLISQARQDVQSAMDHYYDIFKHSWRKEPEISPLFHRELAEYLSLKGKLRLFVLYFKKGEPQVSADIPISSYESFITSEQSLPDDWVPVATSFYAISGTYACMLKTAYKEDYATYSAGTVLSWFAVKWLLDMDRAAVIDFQKEDDVYKFKWGRLNEMHVLFQAANSRSLLAVLELWGEKTLMPLLRKIKKTRLWPIVTRLSSFFVEKNVSA
jgi:CelD/BcsL family acetyltransferase involved in cellulose biosynthesis